MGFRYLVEDLQFQESYLNAPKNYSIKKEHGRDNSYDKLLKAIRVNSTFKSEINKAIEIFKKCDYNRAKGAYSNPITQEYKKELQLFVNTDTSV